MDKKLRQQYYDKFYRDSEARKFYNSPIWKRAKAMKLARDPLCELCKQEAVTTPADMVHHIIPIKEIMRRLDLNFLVSLCHRHHNREESEQEKDRRKE